MPNQDDANAVAIELDVDLSSLKVSHNDDEGWFLLVIPDPVLNESVYEARHADELRLTLSDEVVRQLAAYLSKMSY